MSHQIIHIFVSAFSSVLVWMEQLNAYLHLKHMFAGTNVSMSTVFFRILCQCQVLSASNKGSNLSSAIIMSPRGFIDLILIYSQEVS